MKAKLRCFTYSLYCAIQSEVWHVDTCQHNHNGVPDIPTLESFVKAINKHHGFVACINDTNTSDIVLLCKPPSDIVTPVKVSLGKSSDARVKDESRVYLHKALLWARCPSLRSALPKLGKDPNSDLDAVDATKFSYTVLVNFAHYLYSDELRCSQPLMAELRDCAEHFKCERLREWHVTRARQIDTCINAMTVALCESMLGKNVPLPESTFKADLLQLINSPLFSDVKFTLQSAAGPEVVYAHKFILMYRSEFFRAMFMPTAALHKYVFKGDYICWPIVLTIMVQSWLGGSDHVDGQYFTERELRSTAEHSHERHECDVSSLLI